MLYYESNFQHGLRNPKNMGSDDDSINFNRLFNIAFPL